jgi:hypothetical protein
MSTKPLAALATLGLLRRGIGPAWTPNPEDPATASAALAVTVALLRALRDRGLLSAGEIDDLFGEAADSLRGTSALNLLSRLRGAVEYKEEEE